MRLLMSLCLVASACGGASTPAPAPTANRGSLDTNSGTLGIPNERHLGHIVTGGPPDAAALTRAKTAGFSTVITLRLELEAGFAAEQSAAAEIGLRFVSIPVDGAAGVTESNARLLDEVLAESTGHVLLHCASGNRAGALLALRAFYVQEKSIEEAMQIGLAAGLTNLQSAVRANIEAACSAEDAPPAC